MPPIGWTRVSSTPAAGWPVVQFFTVPRTVPACATAKEAKINAANAIRRRSHRIIMSPGWPVARLAAAAPGIPSLDRFRREPGLPRFQGLFSSLQNHLRSISRSDIQIANHADCHRWCRGVRATGQAWSGEAQDPRHQAEYRKRITRQLLPARGML